jgi:hypothetical protein
MRYYHNLIGQRKNHTRQLLIFTLLFGLSLVANASTWQVCHLQVQVIRHLKNPHYLLEAKVLDVRAAPANAECPAKNAVITFNPETKDYQQFLPFKRWPKIGTKIKMRYQYLDGYCKNDTGPTIPCRIDHYPVP